MKFWWLDAWKGCRHYLNISGKFTCPCDSGNGRVMSRYRGFTRSRGVSLCGLRPVGRKWNGGGFYCKKWTFPQRRVHYVQYQYFLFYILLVWGCVRTQRTPPPTGLPPSSRTLRDQYDAAKTLACTWWRNGVTHCNGIDVLPYCNCVQTCRHSYNQKYISYRNVARKEPNHLACTKNLVKIIHRNVLTDIGTDRRTDTLVTILRSLGPEKNVPVMNAC